MEDKTSLWRGFAEGLLIDAKLVPAFLNGGFAGWQVSLHREVSGREVEGVSIVHWVQSGPVQRFDDDMRPAGCVRPPNRGRCKKRSSTAGALLHRTPDNLTDPTGPIVSCHHSGLILP